jgi:3-methyladenine DNA glycosylase/8-oxoguanine DNA glycosylase
MSKDLARARRTACRALADREQLFARLLDQYGHPDPFAWHDGERTGSSQFAAMLLHIVGQQISARVASAVYDQIIAAAGGIPTPQMILTLGAERLRECGLSAAKARYALALAETQVGGDDEAVMATLTAVAGIGVWSAETFLVHNLHRPDVLPAGDLGIRRAVRRHWNLDDLPPARDVRAQGAAWAPYRTYAGALPRRSLSPPDEPSDPKQRSTGRTYPVNIAS